MRMQRHRESGDDFMRRFERKPLAWAKLDVNVRGVPRDQEELRRLGESYKKRPIHPLIAKLDGLMVDGTRRVIGLRLIGETEAEFLITDEDLKPEDIIEIGLITAMHRADLTGYEKWQGCLKLLERHPEWQNKDLAAHLDIDPSMVPRLMAASNTVPAVQEAYKTLGVNQAQVYAISKENPEQQLTMLAAALGGTGRDKLASAGRKARNSNGGGTLKLARVKAPLPSGIEVVISGKELGLDEVIEALGEVLKEAKKANDSGLDVKTWAAVLRDKAKVGA
jgi:ParB family transcriptional regulator, chromosome partitioning protein